MPLTAPAPAKGPAGSLIAMAANPYALAFPRVSVSPGLETSDCIGTIAPMANSTAI
jgi:hypothetical protein